MWKIFLAVLLLTAGPARADEEKTPTLEVKVGQPFHVSVDDHSAGTGYVTVVRSLPPGLVLVDTELKARVASEPGAPAVKTFTFIAETPLQGLLEINAARMWEKPLNWLHKPGGDNKGQYFYTIDATDAAVLNVD